LAENVLYHIDKEFLAEKKINDFSLFYVIHEKYFKIIIHKLAVQTFYFADYGLKAYILTARSSCDSRTITKASGSGAKFSRSCLTRNDVKKRSIYAVR